MYKGYFPRWKTNAGTDCILLGLDIVQFCMWLSSFRRKPLLSSSFLPEGVDNRFTQNVSDHQQDFKLSHVYGMQICSSEASAGDEWSVTCCPRAFETFLHSPQHYSSVGHCENGKDFKQLMNADINIHTIANKYFNGTNILQIYACNAKILLLRKGTLFYC